jgi:hypothetical protein
METGNHRSYSFAEVRAQRASGCGAASHIYPHHTPTALCSATFTARQQSRKYGTLQQEKSTAASVVPGARIAVGGKTYLHEERGHATAQSLQRRIPPHLE